MAKSDKHATGTNNGASPAIADGANPINGNVSGTNEQSPSGGDNSIKSGSDGIAPIVNNSADGTIRDPERDGGTVAPKRRGRPPGSRNNSPGKPSATILAPEKGLAVKNDRTKMFQQIAAIHQGAAVLTNAQIFALTDDESRMMANALCDVLDHYNISLGGPAGVWAGLLTAVGVVYGPRYLAIRSMQKGLPPRGAMPATPGAAAVRPAPMNFAGDVAH